MFCLALNLLFKYLMSQYRSQVWLPCLLLTSAGTFMKLYSFAFFNMLFKVLGKRQPGVHSQAWQGNSSNLSACPHKTQTSVPVHTKLKPKCLSTQNWALCQSMKTTGRSAQCSAVTQREENPQRGVCIHMADSLCCTVATNTALESDYTPVAIN